MKIKEKLNEFEQAYNWLFSFVTDPEGKRYRVHKTIEQRRAEMEDAIPQMADFLAFAGHPERKVPSIHVTGTSGKGSVSMMTDAMLQGMRLRTGLHMSPYLQLPTEKLMINGVPLSPERFVDLVDSFREMHEAWAAADGPYTKLRYTQAWTALTYMWLAEQSPEIAVVESGMGGRFDYTNLMPSEIAIITNVAYDHVKSLGPELTDIAWHKAGIIKPNKPAVTGVTEPDLLPILEKEAAEKNSTLYVLNRDFSFEVHDVNTITVHAPFKTYAYVKVGPVGRYQLGNAALAIVALDVLVAEGKLEGPINTAALANFSCPGRMEQVAQNPIIMLDGAHNPHKMEALVSSVSEAFPDKKIIAVIGFI
ncbi:MAG: Mur ligase family protein, partial [Chloroflexota bacterium]